MSHNKKDITLQIKQEALRLGFLDCGFSDIRELVEHKNPYNNWLAEGFQAGMTYMEHNIDKRFNPSLLIDNAKTIISLLYNYFCEDSLAGSALKISQYAFGMDYHFVVKDKLKQLDQFIQGLTGEVRQRCFVDSAPILERAWAQNSGLGWIGKNSCLISKKHGSFFFIAEIITSLELENTHQPMRDYCGSCSMCIDSCPTQAITKQRTVNSKRCISYQTIENKGEIDPELKGKFQDYIFGCDICQQVCPWNKKSYPHSEPLFKLKDDLKQMTLSNWISLDEKKYQELFRKSAIKRAKFPGIKRNIKYIINNS